MRPNPAPETDAGSHTRMFLAASRRVIDRYSGTLSALSEIERAEALSSKTGKVPEDYFVPPPAEAEHGELQ